MLTDLQQRAMAMPAADIEQCLLPGFPSRDPNAALVVDVTSEHIDRGTQGDDELCAIALAVREYYPNDAMVEVAGSGAVLVAHRENWWEFDDTPIAEFIRDFDRDKSSVQPQGFVLRRVWQSVHA